MTTTTPVIDSLFDGVKSFFSFSFSSSLPPSSSSSSSSSSASSSSSSCGDELFVCPVTCGEVILLEQELACLDLSEVLSLLLERYYAEDWRYRFPPLAVGASLPPLQGD